MSKEVDDVKEDLVFREAKNIEMEKQIESLKMVSIEIGSTSSSLSTELGMLNLCSHGFKVGECGLCINETEDLSESAVASSNGQNLELKSKLLMLKETELNEGHKCQCKTFCRIFHWKHNWRKSLSDHIKDRFEALKYGPILKEFLSEPCEKTLSNIESMREHMNLENVGVLREDESQSGEV